jgi:hypothetical protein
MVATASSMVRTRTHLTYTHTKIHTYKHTYIHIYIYIYNCLCIIHSDQHFTKMHAILARDLLADYL